MKTLETITADLEYCKELKELGVKQESLFYWVDGNQIIEYGELKKICADNGLSFTNCIEVKRFISAWTANELWKMLPFWVGTFKSEEGAFETYIDGEHLPDHVGSIAYEMYVSDYPQNSMAKMVIHYLKNNIISLEEVNKNI